MERRVTKAFAYNIDTFCTCNLFNFLRRSLAFCMSLLTWSLRAISLLTAAANSGVAKFPLTFPEIPFKTLVRIIICGAYFVAEPIASLMPAFFKFFNLSGLLVNCCISSSLPVYFLIMVFICS